MNARVLQLHSWVGGVLPVPADLAALVGEYVGVGGLETAIGDGADIRGAEGEAGSVGNVNFTDLQGSIAAGADSWVDR